MLREWVRCVRSGFWALALALPAAAQAVAPRDTIVLTSTIDGGLGAVDVLGISERGEVFAAGSFVTAGSQVSMKVARAATTCPATVSTVGVGCVGSVGLLDLRADNLPFAGSTFRAFASGLPGASLAVHVLGLGVVSLPLPTPGCSLFASPHFVDVLVPTGGAVTATFAIPGVPTLAGQVVFEQVVGLELGSLLGLTGVTGTNALQLVVGAL
jgi:hypothetical protein